MSGGDILRWMADRLVPPENPTPEELERILRPGLPTPGPVERFTTWPADYVAPDAPALFRRSIPEVRARAATSRYWAQRLRWLRKRGRA